MKTFHLANLSLMRKAICCEFCEKILKLLINLEIHMITVHLANLSLMSKALQGCQKVAEPFPKSDTSL